MRSLVHIEYSLTEEHMTGDETSGTILNVTNPSSKTCFPAPPNHIISVKFLKVKAVPLYAAKALVRRDGTATVHS
jgi:hypothetical protein